MCGILINEGGADGTTTHRTGHNAPRRSSCRSRAKPHGNTRESATEYIDNQHTAVAVFFVLNKSVDKQ